MSAYLQCFGIFRCQPTYLPTCLVERYVSVLIGTLMYLWALVWLKTYLSFCFPFSFSKLWHNKCFLVGFYLFTQKTCQVSIFYLYLSVKIVTEKMLVRWGEVCENMSSEIWGGCEQVAWLPEGTWETSIVWRNHCVHRSKSACTVCDVCSLCFLWFLLLLDHCVHCSKSMCTLQSFSVLCVFSLVVYHVWAFRKSKS